MPIKTGREYRAMSLLLPAAEKRLESDCGERDYIVYVHRFPNGKRYVGITCKPVRRRWENGAGYSNQPIMKRAIAKYGWENIQHEILHHNLTKQAAENIEVDLIKDWHLTDRKYGYNVDNGGSTHGKHSEESKEKMRVNRKGKCTGEKNCKYGANMSGENNPFYGKKHTDAARDKMRNAKRDICGFKNPWARAVECSGKVFGSVKECADYFGVNRDVLSGYLSGRRKISKRFIDMNLCYAEGR